MAAKKMWLVLLGIMISLAGCNTTENSSAKLSIVENSKSNYVIVEAANPIESETFAATELSDFIEKVTGVKLPVISESKFKGDCGIYLGQTNFAKNHEIDFNKLGEEEWLIKADGNNLIISGGRTRGTLYAVYEFLESCAGIRFLTAQNTHIPSKTSLSISDKICLNGSPAFLRREIYMTVSGGLSKDDIKIFQIRRMLNSFANAARQIGAKYGYSIEYGSPYSTHVHHRYVKDFKEDFNKPEYFALREKGTRTFPDGQVCMSNPKVRELFTKGLLEYIKRDRKKAKSKGLSYPTIYSLTPDDGSDGKCFCKECMAKVKKYDSYAGVVLEFINTIAKNISEKHPEITLIAPAYSYYRDVPKGIKANKNIIISIAQLGAEFNTFPKRDTVRSMLNPVNSGSRKEWEGWSKLGNSLGVHDYWTLWQQPYQWPHANIRSLAETLKFYHSVGLKHFFTEDELMGTRIHNFVDLQFYMASKLFVNPDLNTEDIIEEFMDLHYGKASSKMKELLKYIERRQEEEKKAIALVPPSERTYFDRDFFLTADKLLTDAEKLTGGNPRILADITLERLAFDETMLYLWNKFSKNKNLNWPFEREKLLARLENNYEYAYKKYGGWGNKNKKNDQLRLEYLNNMPSTPAQFEGKKFIDMCGPLLNLLTAGGKLAVQINDPEAAAGKAWQLNSSCKNKGGIHNIAPEFGLSDCVSKPKFLCKQVIEKDKIPQDEKYHWYKIGKMQATPTMYFYAHHSWGLAQRLLTTYNGALPDQNFYDAYVSLKLEGPAYVKGSKKQNAFTIDRLIFVQLEN